MDPSVAPGTALKASETAEEVLDAEQMVRGSVLSHLGRRHDRPAERQRPTAAPPHQTANMSATPVSTMEVTTQLLSFTPPRSIVADHNTTRPTPHL